jgi:hypothetical protein
MYFTFRTGFAKASLPPNFINIKIDEAEKKESIPKGKRKRESGEHANKLCVF